MEILSGLRVLDFSTAVAAPYCAMLLADLGASVIKIEKPRRGDLARFTDTYVNGKSGYFLGINRGKRCMTLDLRREAGQEIALEMCREADVVVENFRPGMMKRWGLAYENVKAINPDVIYCSVSAFGDAKGFESETGNDIIAQAYSGLMALTGESTGPPAKAGTPVTDVAAAFLATISVLAALLRRRDTGAGAHTQTSLLEAAYGLMPNYLPSVMNGSPTFRRLGSGHSQLAPYQAYPTADGKYIVIGAFHQESWKRLCNALDRRDLIDDARLSDNALRVEHRDILNALLSGELVKRDLEHWLRVLREFDVPVAPVLEIEESVAFFEEQFGAIFSDEMPSNAGNIRMLRAPFAIDGVRPCHPRGAAELGSSTDEILADLGRTVEAVNELRETGIV